MPQRASERGGQVRGRDAAHRQLVGTHEGGEGPQGLADPGESGVAVESPPGEGRRLLLRDVTPDVARGQSLDASDQGVMVVDVKPGSPAERASIRKGDIILEVNHEPVKSVAEVTKNVANSANKDSLLLLVQRNGSSLFVALTS